MWLNRHRLGVSSAPPCTPVPGLQGLSRMDGRAASACLAVRPPQWPRRADAAIWCPCSCDVPAGQVAFQRLAADEPPPAGLDRGQLAGASHGLDRLAADAERVGDYLYAERQPRFAGAAVTGCG